MFSDPKQFMLLHIEKVVLGVFVLLLALVVYFYHPWNVVVPEKANIRRILETGENQIKSKVWNEKLEVTPYIETITGLIERPWPAGQAPALYPQNKVVFLNIKSGGIREGEVSPPPPVVAVRAVYAKGERGQVLVIFRLDDNAERRALEDTGISDYQGGLEVDHIEIRRVEKDTHNSTVVTPPNWVPQGLPQKYGGSSATGASLAPQDLFGVPVYVFAQADTTKEDETRKAMEEMKKRLEDEAAKHAADAKAKKDEADKGKGDVTEPTPTPVPTPKTTPKTGTTPKSTGKAAPAGAAAASGWYYFVDQNDVEPDTRYEYNVVIYCKNPAAARNSRAVAIVKSDPVGTPVGGEVKVESFKKWYFTGGVSSDQVEKGSFRVRSIVGGRKEFTAEEINDVVNEMNGGESKVKAKATGKGVEPEGIWVEAPFTVQPGEEIGGRATVVVGTERREVDFGTGCYVVAIQNDIEVVVEPRNVIVPGPNGVMTNVTRMTTRVVPRMRLDYMDKKGVLKSTYQQVAPPMPKASDSK